MTRRRQGAVLRAIPFLFALTLAPALMACKADAAPRLEAGLFGQYAAIGRGSGIDNALGIGGRLGIFNAGGVGVELDGAHSNPGGNYLVGVGEYLAPFTYSETDLHARFTLNRSLGGWTQLVLGFGYSRVHLGRSYFREDDAHGANILFGLRQVINSKLALRGDLNLEQFPGQWNENGAISDSDRYAISFGLSYLSGSQ